PAKRVRLNRPSAAPCAPAGDLVAPVAAGVWTMAIAPPTRTRQPKTPTTGGASPATTTPVSPAETTIDASPTRSTVRGDPRSAIRPTSGAARAIMTGSTKNNPPAVLYDRPIGPVRT